MFERIGLPSWLVARTVDDFVKAAVRLIGDDDTRVALARELGPQAVQKFFFGRPEIFGEMLYGDGDNRWRRLGQSCLKQQGFSMMRHSVLVGLLAVLVAASAAAQTPPAAKPPAAAPAPPAAPAPSNDPAQTTATYGDWVLRCVRPEKGPH
ncbi:MAG TPA: hypothetical protein VGJ56_01945, partial [Reyranella sp.]